jgi:hypothetical protein
MNNTTLRIAQRDHAVFMAHYLSGIKWAHIPESDCVLAGPGVTIKRRDWDGFSRTTCVDPQHYKPGRPTVNVQECAGDTSESIHGPWSKLAPCGH